jgi:hypothetical protein
MVRLFALSLLMALSQAKGTFPKLNTKGGFAFPDQQEKRKLSDMEPAVEMCTATKAMYKDSACCGGKANMQSVCMSKEIEPAEKAKVPEIAGIMPGPKLKINLAYDMWSPYVYIHDTTGELTGFGPEFIKLMQSDPSPACSALDITMVQDVWSRMWNDLRGGESIHPGNPWNTDILGDGVNYGLYHAGITYTHLKGVRPRMGDFSYAITKASAQPAGILVKLNTDGTPMVSPTSDLAGMKIVDVANYAPTIDTFKDVQNWCNGGTLFSTDIEFISPPRDGNAAAMKVFRERSDVMLMYVYADQAYDCAGAAFTGDCVGWEGLGTEFAYIHTGLDPNINGTTVAFGKKNSGLMEAINPCIQAVMQTQEYYTLCNSPERPPLQMSTNMAKCFPNAFWSEAELASADPLEWHYKQHERVDALTCKDGYCTCSELPS